jgi:hypothetical protein
MSAHDEPSVTLPASTRPSGRSERAPDRRTITAFRAAVVSGLTFGTGLAGFGLIRFNAVAWRGSQLLSAAILLAVAAGGVWYWRKAQVWLDVLKDLHT